MAWEELRSGGHSWKGVRQDQGDFPKTKFSKKASSPTPIGKPCLWILYCNIPCCGFLLEGTFPFFLRKRIATPVGRGCSSFSCPFLHAKAQCFFWSYALYARALGCHWTMHWQWTNIKQQATRSKATQIRKYYEMLDTVLGDPQSFEAKYVCGALSKPWLICPGLACRFPTQGFTRIPPRGGFLWPCCTPCWQTCQDRIPYSGASGICATWCFEFVAVLRADMGMPLLQDDASACRPDYMTSKWFGESCACACCQDCWTREYTLLCTLLWFFRSEPFLDLGTLTCHGPMDSI